MRVAERVTTDQVTKSKPKKKGGRRDDGSERERETVTEMTQTCWPRVTERAEANWRR